MDVKIEMMMVVVMEVGIKGENDEGEDYVSSRMTSIVRIININRSIQIRLYFATDSV